MRHNDPLVSVIIPTYNASEFISSTISSVLSQTYKNWEIIFVDDCSTDSTAQILSSYVEQDKRIKLIKLDNNFGGPAGPRNIGVKEAKGDFIAFLDADDIWHKQKLEIQIKTIVEQDAIFCCSSMNDFHYVETIDQKFINQPKMKTISFDSLSLRSQIPTSSVLVSKKLIQRFPFNESRVYKAVEDYDCWLRILAEGNYCEKVIDTLLFYRKSPGQISGSKISMVKKVFMVHKNLKNRGILWAIFYTLSHIVGGFYFRLIKGTM